MKGPPNHRTEGVPGPRANYGWSGDFQHRLSREYRSVLSQPPLERKLLKHVLQAVGGAPRRTLATRVWSRRCDTPPRGTTAYNVGLKLRKWQRKYGRAVGRLCILGEPCIPKRGQNFLLKPTHRTARVRLSSIASGVCRAIAARGPLSLFFGIPNQTARSVEPSGRQDTSPADGARATFCSPPSLVQHPSSGNTSTCDAAVRRNPYNRK